MARVNDLANDKVLGLVLRLAVPAMLAQFVNVLYSIVDRMYIGNIPDIGGTALAGVGVCGPIVTLISSFAFLIGIGGAPLMSMRMGEGNKKGAQQILANCFVLLLGLSVTLAAVFFVAKQHLLYWFGASEVTYPYANEYLSVYLAGTVFALLSVGLNQFIVCQGFSTIAMTSVLIGAVCNILLDPVFIFLFDMGVTGAALATVLSQAASCFFTLTFLFGRRTRIKITFGGYSWRIMRRVMIFGLSPFLIAASDSVILIVFNSVLQRYGGPQNGDTYVACATIVQSYMQIITLPLGGITGGTQPVLSFNYGAKRTDRIKSGFRNILTLCILFNGIMFLLSQIVPQLFVRIFTQDPQYLELSAWGIRVFTAGVLILAFQYTFVDGLTALGIAKVAVTLSLLRKVFFLGATVLLPPVFGAKAAFFAEPIADIAGGIVSITVFALLIGKILRKREEMPDGQALYAE